MEIESNADFERKHNFFRIHFYDYDLIWKLIVNYMEYPYLKLLFLCPVLLNVKCF